MGQHDAGKGWDWAAALRSKAIREKHNFMPVPYPCNLIWFDRDGLDMLLCMIDKGMASEEADTAGS
ncbi:MAG TPA: hypothetical protein VKF36_23360 [Syntrophorhabdales bacterium]|nr:hypothetical protein [Syntrophorhabdales bacterium]